VARVHLEGHPHAEVATAKRLEYLNALFEDEARRFFRTACSATAWVEKLSAARPFATAEDLLSRSRTSFAQLTEKDWLEAFAGHPRIGERGDQISDGEQSEARLATSETLGALAEVNRTYEERFGFTYIVYATGKTGEEMLAIARQRLANTREVEIQNAGGEQERITETRLRRMLCQATR
jgi:OHCU decarboxylase